MLKDAIDVLGPWPLVQLIGGLGFLYVALMSARKGKSDPGNLLPPPPAEVKMPDWFMDDFKAQEKNVQRILYVVEDLRNQLDLFKTSGRVNRRASRDSDQV